MSHDPRLRRPVSSRQRVQCSVCLGLRHLWMVAAGLLAPRPWRAAYVVQVDALGAVQQVPQVPVPCPRCTPVAKRGMG